MLLHASLAIFAMRIFLILMFGILSLSPADAACHNKRTKSACAAAKACAWDKEKQQCY
jgi:hypothetical protein